MLNDFSSNHFVVSGIHILNCSSVNVYDWAYIKPNIKPY